MKNFDVKFNREFQVQVQADTLEIAETLARQVIAQFPADTCTLLSIVPEGQVAVPRPDPPTKPFGRPNGGGSPGTPVVKQEILVDQIAEAA